MIGDTNSKNSNPNQVITDERLWNEKNFFLALGIGVILIIGAVITLFYTELTFTQGLMILAGLTVLYAIILFFLLEPGILRRVHTSDVRTIEVEKPIIYYKKEPVYVEKKVYVKEPKKPRTPPKVYKFVASTETKMYHSNSSRLARLIKQKNRIYGDSPQEFAKAGYKPSKSASKRISREKL